MHEVGLPHGGTVRRVLTVMVALAAAAGAARADDRVDLRVRRAPVAVPAPASLAMRSEAAATPAPEPAPTPAEEARRDTRYDPIPLDLTDLSQRVIFRFQLGYGIDQGQVPDDAVLQSGQPLGPPYRNTRLYTLGDAVLGTNGVLVPSLETYFAAHFQLDQDGRPEAAAIPTVYDGATDSRAFLIRSAYAQLDDLGGRLKPLFVRAGRQFRHGLAIAHFDGITAAYETRAVDLSLWFGRRVALYGPGSDPFALGEGDPGVLSGGEVRLRLDRFTSAPVALGFEVFTIDGSKRHAEATLAIFAWRDVTVTAASRLNDNKLARWRAGARARLSRTTTAQVEIDQRLDADWLYDFVLPARATDGESPRTFLILGPPASRLRLSARAGTVLLDNLDLLLFGAIARADDDPEPNNYLPTYYELGGAVEGRFRAGLSAGVALRARQYRRPDALAERPPDDGIPAPLQGEPILGELGFQEGTLEARYSAGPRRFAGEAEIYLRHVRRQTVYQPLAIDDFIEGLRFRFEGWMGPRFRVLVEYELAGVPEVETPELTGVQSLRLIAEASF